MDPEAQKRLYAEARRILEAVLPLLADEKDPKAVLTALLLLTARQFQQMGLDSDTALGVLAVNTHSMIEMWQKAEGDTANVIVFPGGKDKG